MGRLGLLKGGNPLLDRTQLRLLSHGVYRISSQAWREEMGILKQIRRSDSHAHHLVAWRGPGAKQSLRAKNERRHYFIRGDQ